MNAKRAQDLLRHLTQDEDFGAAVIEQLPVGEAIELENELLTACIKKADEDGNQNDSNFFGQLQAKFRPLIIEKIKKADRMWMVYSDITGYPYEIDGDLMVVYNYADSKRIGEVLNKALFKPAFSEMDAVNFANEISHMYRNGYQNVRFCNGTAEPFVVSREELYPYEQFFTEEYITNPAFSNSMISFFQEFRKQMMVTEEELKARQDMIGRRESTMIRNMIHAEFMVPCTKHENAEETEIEIAFIDLSERVAHEEGEQVIAIPVFTDGFEMDKCYPDKHENMLCTFEEVADMIEEVEASGMIINCLGISYYADRETVARIRKDYCR